MTTMVSAYVSGSVDFTPNNNELKLSKYLVNTNADANPTPIPIAANAIPCCKTIRNTSLRRAPRAMRIPISCVRRLTE